MALQRVDDALSGQVTTARQGRRPPLPFPQTYLPQYDFRRATVDPAVMAKFRIALGELQTRVSQIDGHTYQFIDDGQLCNELCLRAAEARLYQVQAEEGSSEWETALAVVRTLTRIVAEETPGFVYGLALGHNTDWGMKISEVLSTYTPIPLKSLPERAAASKG